jgi:two-component system chemotaxis sensor kinase CheA
LELEANPENMEILNAIFRVAHTLKGLAGAMGFTKMQKLTHALENVLSEIRNGKIKVSADKMDFLFESLDALENYVECIVNTSEEGNTEYPDLMRTLESIAENSIQSKTTSTSQSTPVKENKPFALPEEHKAVVEAALQMNKQVLHLEIHLAETCVLKAARAFIVFSELDQVGEVIYTVPTTQEIEEEKFDRSFHIVLVTDRTIEEIESVMNSISEVTQVSCHNLLEEPQEPQESISTTGATAQPVQVPEKKETEVSQSASKEAEGDNSAKTNKQQVANKSVRVNIDRLDTLMNLVSELIIVKTQLEGIDSKQDIEGHNYEDSIEYLERITSNLHDAVMKVRMVPVETVFNRFPRMIRDISRQLGKDIELVMKGEETELDRTVIDELGDPLIHLLRNAADHGLETTAERMELGKPAKGTIILQAYQDGNNVVIEVIDDGKGINVNQVKQKAIEKGTLPKEVAESLSDQEAIELLFRPSFSMAKQVSDLSGRGVGLDVVKSKIHSLGGQIEVKSQLGKGSAFIVRLPLTLAIIQVLMVKIGGEKYAIPLESIQNIESIHVDDIKLVRRQEVIVLRGEVIPIIRLNEVLDIPLSNQKELKVVIVRKGEKQTGFIVDQLIGQQEVVIKSLGKYFNNIKMIAGATILGNGEVALILDINTLA